MGPQVLQNPFRERNGSPSSIERPVLKSTPARDVTKSELRSAAEDVIGEADRNSE